MQLYDGRTGHYRETFAINDCSGIVTLLLGGRCTEYLWFDERCCDSYSAHDSLFKLSLLNLYRSSGSTLCEYSFNALNRRNF